MKKYTCLFLAAICISVLLSDHTHAQMKRSPKYGIAYEANGYDEASAGYVEKRARKIEQKFGAAAAEDFRQQTERLRLIGEWLDTKWAARVAAWSRCYDVSDVNPRRFFVTVEGNTFTLPQYPELKYIWGTVDTSAKRIRVTAWAYIKNRGWTVNAIDTAEWEFGNALMLLKRGPAPTVADEIGTGDPCKAR